mmetsp:Transcript_90004/g.280121  ORF Transcript_90004/g.280121 Transcript_90004/m.280121 type:complete len:433 (+) Transcript_90004:42-1340(+)
MSAYLHAHAHGREHASVRARRPRTRSRPGPVLPSLFVVAPRVVLPARAVVPVAVAAVPVRLLGLAGAVPEAPGTPAKAGHAEPSPPIRPAHRASVRGRLVAALVEVQRGHARVHAVSLEATTDVVPPDPHTRLAPAVAELLGGRPALGLRLEPSALGTRLLLRYGVLAASLHLGDPLVPLAQRLRLVGIRGLPQPRLLRLRPLLLHCLEPRRRVPRAYQPPLLCRRPGLLHRPPQGLALLPLQLGTLHQFLVGHPYLLRSAKPGNLSGGLLLQQGRGLFARLFLEHIIPFRLEDTLLRNEKFLGLLDGVLVSLLLRRLALGVLRVTLHLRLMDLLRELPHLGLLGRPVQIPPFLGLLPCQLGLCARLFGGSGPGNLCVGLADILFVHLRPQRLLLGAQRLRLHRRRLEFLCLVQASPDGFVPRHLHLLAPGH